jgi:peroxiredoxin
MPHGDYICSMQHSLLRTLILGTLCYFVSCSSPEKKFRLDGQLSNYNDSVVYLMASSDAMKIDTVPVIEGKFHFERVLTEPTVFMMNVGEDFPPYFFMAENATMELRYDLQNPTAAKVTGGKEQTIYEQYLNQCKPFFATMDSLGNQASSNEENPVMIKQLQQQFFRVDSAFNRMQVQFIRDHPSQYTSAFIASNYLSQHPQENEEEMENLLGTLSPNIKASYYGSKIEKKINQFKHTKIGAKAPSFSLPDKDGNPITLQSLRGKVVMLDFWASWCLPCRRENPQVVEVYSKFHSKGLEILGISLDTDKNAWLAAVEKDKLVWKQVSDLNGWTSDVAEAFRVEQIPSNFILDSSGKIIAKNVHGEELYSVMNNLFSSPTP